MNIEYEMHEFGAEVYDGDELVMEVSWDRDDAEEYGDYYLLRDFSVYRPENEMSISYGTVYIGHPFGVAGETLDRAVYVDGELVGYAMCRWLMYHVALLGERHFELAA